MASGVDVRLNMAGVVEVLNDDRVIADCRRRMEAVARAADAMMPDNGHGTDEHHRVIEGTTTRGNREVSVMTVTNVAKNMQARHGTLTRALDAGGG